MPTIRKIGTNESTVINTEKRGRGRPKGSKNKNTPATKRQVQKVNRNGEITHVTLHGYENGYWSVAPNAIIIDPKHGKCKPTGETKLEKVD